jgi:hypothetical protein
LQPRAEGNSFRPSFFVRTAAIGVNAVLKISTALRLLLVGAHPDRVDSKSYLLASPAIRKLVVCDHKAFAGFLLSADRAARNTFKTHFLEFRQLLSLLITAGRPPPLQGEHLPTIRIFQNCKLAAKAGALVLTAY